MSSGSIVFTAEASSFSIGSSTNTPKKNSNNTNNNSNNNRLAPYNPTHATAQSSALDLLSLTPNDIFFDLGCGDGRLVIAALERCYDDDYLMRIHEEQFARLQLQQPLIDTPLRPPPQPQSPLQQRQDIIRSSLNTNSTPTSTNSRKIYHARSYSTDYSVPHLMRTSSNDDDSGISGFDSSPYHHRRGDSNGNGGGSDNSSIHGNGRKEYFTNINIHGNANHGGDANNGDGGSEHSGTDVLSALSPTSQRKLLPLAPESPITPIACNRGLGRFHHAINGIISKGGAPSFPSMVISPTTNATGANAACATDNIMFTTPIESHVSDDGLVDSIPKTIETPSPNNRRGSFHTSQISELPMTESLYADINVDESSLLLLSSSLAGPGAPLMSVPSGDVMVDDYDDGHVTNLNRGSPAKTSHGAVAKAGACAAAATSRVQGAGIINSGGGLQCIGIEYNQALAETAQSNVQKSYIYPHVERKVCIRWGDVLEEWNGSGGGSGKHVSWNSEECNDLNGRGGHLTIQEQEYPEGEKDNASELNLIKDATAVFVYLLPQGLRKVKPLLYKAAVLRRRQQAMQQEQEGQQLKQQPHPLHPLQQCSLHETEETTNPAEYYGESCPLPRQQVHRKGYSHMSDITDYDFRTSSSMLSMDNVGNSCKDDDGVVGAGNLQRVEEQHHNGDGVSKRSTKSIPSFRVVSYMFSIPGWTPTKVDRSSKGACPLYLYENIHEEEG